VLTIYKLVPDIRQQHFQTHASIHNFMCANCVTFHCFSFLQISGIQIGGMYVS